MNFIKPKACDLCKDPIGLYKPWYSIKVKGFWAYPTKDLKANPLTLCPDCFHAYKDFLIQHEVQENHRRQYGELIKEISK